MWEQVAVKFSSDALEDIGTYVLSTAPCHLLSDSSFSSQRLCLCRDYCHSAQKEAPVRSQFRERKKEDAIQCGGPSSGEPSFDAPEEAFHQ
jgi:hypothetical protein